MDPVDPDSGSAILLYIINRDQDLPCTEVVQAFKDRTIFSHVELSQTLGKALEGNSEK